MFRWLCKLFAPFTPEEQTALKIGDLLSEGAAINLDSVPDGSQYGRIRGVKSDLLVVDEAYDMPDTGTCGDGPWGQFVANMQNYPEPPHDEVCQPCAGSPITPPPKVLDTGKPAEKGFPKV